MDFSIDHDGFENLLSRVNREWDRSRKSFEYHVERWQDIATHHYGSLAEINYSSEESLVTGAVLGRAFELRLNALKIADAGYAEAVLTSKGIDGETIELDRFLINKEGNVLNTRAELVLSDSEVAQSYRIMIAVFAKVIESPRETGCA